MNMLAFGLVLMLATGSAHAGWMDCAALANSALPEPIGYSEQCVHRPAMPLQAIQGAGTPTHIGLALDIRGQAAAGRPDDALYTFLLGDFPGQILVGESSQPSILALDFSPDGETLFGITSRSPEINALTLGTIDQTTGAFTAIAPLVGLPEEQNTTGLTIDPLTGEAYYSAFGGTPGASHLYRIDLTTAQLAPIGQMTAPTDGIATIMIDIAINCEGHLYAHNISDGALYSIDPATGAGTFIGGHGLDANFAQGMDFDNRDGTLYAFIYTGGGTNQFGTFDLASGAFTALAADDPLGEFEGAMPGPCLPPEIFVDGFE